MYMSFNSFGIYYLSALTINCRTRVYLNFDLIVGEKL